MNVYPMYHGVSCYPSLLTLCLQVTHRKMINLQKGGEKLVEKVSLNLIHHATSAVCINIIISVLVDVNAHHNAFTCSTKLL